MRRHLVYAATTLATVAAAACTVQTASQDTSPSHHPATTATVTGRTGAESGPETAYRRFWSLAQTLDRYPEAQWRRRLSEVAAEPLLSRVITGLQQRVEAGYRQYGTVSTAPTVELAGDRATILDCQDASRTGEIDSATGLATNLGHAHTTVTATLILGSDHHWRVTDARYLPDSC